MERSLDGRRLLGAVGAVVLATCVVAVWIGLRVGGARATLWVDDGVTPLAALTACVLCFRARAREGGRMRLFWLLLGLATASWTLAEVMWGYYALILNVEVPSPSWADIGYLAAIPLAVAALVVHPATRGSGTRKARWMFDGLVVATALLFLSWTLVLGSLWRSADLSTWAGVVTLAYPFGDVVIVFFIVLAIRGMTGQNRLSLWCLLAALLAMALSDSTYTYLTEVPGYSSSSANPIDAGWIAAYLGIALAAFSSRPGGACVADRPPGAGAAGADRRRRTDQARRSPRPRGLADGVWADRTGIGAPGADGARAARARPRHAGRRDAAAHARRRRWRGRRGQTGLPLSGGPSLLSDQSS
jgi:hypothetical protein